MNTEYLIKSRIPNPIYLPGANVLKKENVFSAEALHDWTNDLKNILFDLVNFQNIFFDETTFSNLFNLFHEMKY